MKLSITSILASFFIIFQAQAVTVYGTVTLNGTGLPGVSITAGAQTSCTDTDASGAYTCTIPDIWPGGPIMPWLDGYEISGVMLGGFVRTERPLGPLKIDFVANARQSGGGYENIHAEFVAGADTGNVSKPYLDMSFYVRYRIETGHIGRTLNYYVCAIPNSTIYCLDSQGNWQPWSDTPVAAMTTVAKTEYTSVPVLSSRTDVSRYFGTTIYAGYGTDIADVMNNQRYKKIFTISTGPLY